MPLMRKLMLYFDHFQIHNLMRVKVTGVAPPIAVVAPCLDLSLAVVLNLIPSVLVGGQVWTPPIIWQLLGGLLGVEMSHDYKNWMVLMQVEWNEGDQGPLGSRYSLVMAWAINCQPSPRLTGLALSLACLPTQLMAPDNVIVVSHTLTNLSTSPNDHCP